MPTGAKNTNTATQLSRYQMALQQTFRRACWTVHFNVDDYAFDPAEVTEDEVRMQLAQDFIFAMPDNFASTRYSVAQVERGAEGRIHIQGYSEWDKPLRLSTVKSTIPCLATAHIEAARGSRQQCRDYCTKADTQVSEPVEVGHFDAGGQGHRSDLDGLVEAVKAGATDRELAAQFPKQYLLHGQKIQALREALKPAPADNNFTPRPWQQDLIDRLKEEADDRSIIWVVDSQGGKGKSRLAYHLVCEHKACYLSGKVGDMSYMYNGERIVIFDISRAAAEHSDHLYTMAENLKNRLVVSNKYQSVLKQVEHNIHVVFFANQLPTEGKWSQDRVTLINLDI